MKPLIGVTCFSLEVPCDRSAVNQQYISAVVDAGGAPVAIPVGLDEESTARVYAILDGLLLPGGDDVDPAQYGETRHPMLGNVDELRDSLELTLARWAFRDDVPVLGICRGIQVMAVAGGGTLYQDLPAQCRDAIRHEVREYGRDYLAHAVDIEPQSRLSAALGRTRTQVNTFHHQAVKDLLPGFLVSARSSDGVVEGIEAVGDRFLVGVQCHPEEMWSSSAPEFARLFRAFVDAARSRSRSLRSSA